MFFFFAGRSSRSVHLFNLLSLRVSKQATVRDQGVRAALLPIGRSEIELLEPIDAAGGVAKFLARRGEGLHHVCFETADVGAELAAARAQAFPLIDEAPRAGLAGMICFLHPKGTRGVLVEFATPPPDDAHHPHAASARIPGLALDEVVARSRDAEGAATLFAERLGLARASAGAAAGPRPGRGADGRRAPRLRRAPIRAPSARRRPRGRRPSTSRARGCRGSCSASATSARRPPRSARSRRRQTRAP